MFRDQRMFKRRIRLFTLGTALTVTASLLATLLPPGQAHLMTLGQPKVSLPQEQENGQDETGVSFSSDPAANVPLASLLAAPAANDDTLKQNNGLLKIIGRDTYQLMSQLHLSKKKFDKDLASEGLDFYLKTLDPMKQYFYQEDVNEFEKREAEILKAWPMGDIKIAYDIFNRYLQRIDEQLAVADELIDSDFDFTIDETLVTDRDLLEYCSTPEQMRERWRQRIKYSLMLLDIEASEAAKEAAEKAAKEAAEPTPATEPAEAGGADAADSGVVAKAEEPAPREKLHRRYRSLKRRMHQFTEDDVAEMFLTSLTSCYDPHTSYMSPSSYDDFLIMMRLNLEGIGATLQSTDDGLTAIRRVVPGGAAEKSGAILVDDKIVAVGQDSGSEMVDITDMRLKDVVSMIRGKAGTTVRLSVMREGVPGIKTISIIREQIELTDSAARGKVFEEGTKADGTPFKLGVIELPSFYTDMEGARNNVDDFRSTTRDVQKLLEGFKKESVDAVVLDLRLNGGGSLREAIDCTGLFIDQGPVVQVKDPIGQIEQLDDTQRGLAWDGPLVVMTSKFSASASEILAGAIQDYGRGLIVGDKATHGKGTVQNLLNLAAQYYSNAGQAGQATTLGALKITIQQFYRPSGDSTQKRGVEADIVLPSISTHMDVGEADLDYAMEFDRIPAAKFSKLEMVDSNLLAQLKQASESRLSTSEKFQKLQRDIQRYVEQKDRKSVTLQKEAYLAEREEFNAERQDEETIEKQINGGNDEIKRDFYLDEVLQITIDYSKMLRKS